SADSAQYSALRQINRSNVKQLEVAWVYPTGDGNRYFFNPIVINGLMYVLAKNNSIVALDAATGKEIWSYSPAPQTRIITNRGINYWESKDRSDRRLLFASNHFLRALDARAGKRLWHFQMVHHDIWDYDGATAPKLLTIRHEGKSVDVVALPGKQGFLWVFNRETGKPIWPIEERRVPASDIPGEETWPTQPFPVKPPPFARQTFTVDDLSPFLSPEDRARFRDEILSARNEGL